MIFVTDNRLIWNWRLEQAGTALPRVSGAGHRQRLASPRARGVNGATNGPARPSVLNYCCLSIPKTPIILVILNSFVLGLLAAWSPRPVEHRRATSLWCELRPHLASRPEALGVCLPWPFCLPKRMVCRCPDQGPSSIHPTHLFLIIPRARPVPSIHPKCKPVSSQPFRPLSEAGFFYLGPAVAYFMGNAVVC